MAEPLKFWMVYLEGGRDPSFAQANMDEARKEAEQLARGNIGKRVFIFVAVQYCFCEQIPVVFKEIP